MDVILYTYVASFCNPQDTWYAYNGPNLPSSTNFNFHLLQTVQQRELEDRHSTTILSNFTNKMFSWSSGSSGASEPSSSSNPLSSALTGSSAAKAEQLKQEVVQQLALANAQELINVCIQTILRSIHLK